LEVIHTQCLQCDFRDPVGEAHYHIIVENGVVTDVWYMSADGYWDRDLEKDEYFVEYGVAGAIARFFTVSRVWGNVPGGMIFDFVNKNNLL
jgi:hypothetical protein